MLKQVNKCVIFSSFRSTLTHCFKMFDFYAPQKYPVIHYDHGQQTTVDKRRPWTARIWMKLSKYWSRHWQHLTTAMRDFFTGEGFIHKKVAIFSRKIAPGPSNRRVWNFHLIRDFLWRSGRLSLANVDCPASCTAPLWASFHRSAHQVRLPPSSSSFVTINSESKV